MSLTIQKTLDEQRQLNITVAVDEDRVQQEMRKVARQLGRDLRIPGFRRGKVPYKVVLGRFGEEVIRAEAVDDMAQTIFGEMLDQMEEEPYAQVRLADVDLSPVVYKFVMPLKPEVDLRDYREIRREIEPVSIADEAVAEKLREVRERHQVLEPVNRPIEKDDVVTLSGKGFLKEAEEETIFDEERIDFTMDGEKVFFGPDFVAAIIGLSAGDEASFSVTFPDDFEDEAFAGKEAQFDIEVLDVKARDLPEIDDDLAREEGEYETLEELKTALREQLQAEAESQARSDFLDAMLETMVEKASIIFPPAAVDLELDGMIMGMRQQITQIGWKWEDYLKLGGKDEGNMRDEMREEAEGRLMRGLVLAQFIENEHLAVDDVDVESQVEERLEQLDNDETKKMMREWLTSDSGRSMMNNDILMDKVYDRLQEIARGEAPDLEALAAAAAAEEE